MRCLILSSCLFVLWSCSPAYNHLQKTTGRAADLQKFKPVFAVALYNTQVDVVGNHLSGLLLVKKMPDSSLRIVFTNEMGFTFFDFEFSQGGEFKVYSIFKKMNKRSVIKTLRKDFELILMQGLDESVMAVRKDSALLYYIFPQSKGSNCYITGNNGNELVRMERVSKTKPVVNVIMQNYINGIPDTIGITHLNFDFTIGLKRIER
jgi:hypothetical protein